MEAPDVLRRLAFESRVGDASSRCRIVQVVGEAAKKDGTCALALLEGDAATTLQLLTEGQATKAIQIACVNSLAVFPSQDECRRFLASDEFIRNFVIDLSKKAVTDLPELQEHVMDMMLSYCVIDGYVSEMLSNNFLELIVQYTAHAPNQSKCGQLLDKLVEVAPATEIREACDATTFVRLLQCATQVGESIQCGVAQVALSLSLASRDARVLSVSKGTLKEMTCLTQAQDSAVASQGEEALANFSDSVALLSIESIQELCQHLFIVYIPNCLEQHESGGRQLTFASRILENLFSEASSLPFLVHQTCMRGILKCLQSADSTVVTIAVQGLDQVVKVDGAVPAISEAGMQPIVASISREEDIQGPAIRVLKRVLLEQPAQLEWHVQDSQEHVPLTLKALIAIAIRDAYFDLATNKGLAILLSYWNREISDEAELATVLENQATFVAQGEFIVEEGAALLADLLRSDSDAVVSTAARVCHFASRPALRKVSCKVDYDLLFKLAAHSDPAVVLLMAKFAQDGSSGKGWVDSLDVKSLLDAIHQIVSKPNVSHQVVAKHSETCNCLARCVRGIIDHTGVFTWVKEYFSLFLEITEHFVRNAEPSVVAGAAGYMKICAEQDTSTFNSKPADLTKKAMKVLGAHPQIEIKKAFCQILSQLVQSEELISHLVDRSMIQPLAKIITVDDVTLRVTVAKILEVVLLSNQSNADRIMFTNQGLPASLLQTISTVATANANKSQDMMQAQLRQKCLLLLHLFSKVPKYHKCMNSKDASSILVGCILRREDTTSLIAMHILQEVFPERSAIRMLCAELEDVSSNGKDITKDIKTEKINQLTVDRDALQAELIQARLSGTAESAKKQVGLHLLQGIFMHWHSQNQVAFFMRWKDIKQNAQMQAKLKQNFLKRIVSTLVNKEASCAIKNLQFNFSTAMSKQLSTGDVQTLQDELDEIKASEGFVNEVALLEAKARYRAAEEKLEAAMKEWASIKDQNIELEHQLRKLTGEPTRSTFANRFLEMKNQHGEAPAVEATIEVQPEEAVLADEEAVA